VTWFIEVKHPMRLKDKIIVITGAAGGLSLAMASKFLAEVAQAAYEASRIPLGRFGEFEDMSGLLVLLASDESSYLAGGVYMADGGMSAK
jgi:NAD(P)-dependent dehydrogenase (short-subunit alcohol dehydrogenase family)